MPHSAYQLLEIVGTSPVSSDDAIRSGIEKATLMHHALDWFQVTETRGQIREGQGHAVPGDHESRHAAG